MRVLVDEAVPVQVLAGLSLNRPHEFDHVNDLQWKGRGDLDLFRGAVARRYDAILTLDVNQLSAPEEWRALRRSGLHHISLQQGRSARGIVGLARVIASIIVAMPYVLAELEAADGQRIVELTLLAARSRHEAFDPRKEQNRYPYWR